MHNLFVARLLEAGKTLKLKSPEFLVEAEVSLADAEKAFKLGRAGIGAEINQVGDGGLLNPDAIALVVVFQVESQVSSSLEVIFPTEMVGKIAFLKPALGHLGAPGTEMERRGKRVSKSNSFQKTPVYAMTL